MTAQNRKFSSRAITKSLGLFIALMVLLHPARSSADDVRNIVSELQKKYEKLGTISADFTQETFSKTLKQKDVARGKVYFKKPGKTRWNYIVPEGDVLASNGKTMWLYQFDLGQVIERHVSDQPDIARDFLSGVGNLERDFSIVIAEDKKSSYLLRLTPKEFQPGIRKLFIEVDRSSYLVTKTIVEDPFGNETTVSLKDIKLNKPIEDSFFEFTVPKGVKVVRP